MATNSGNENPYAAPVAREVLTPEPLPVNEKGLRIRWCVLVAVNVPVPIFFGITTTEGIGRIGMAIGIVIVAGAGLPLCTRFPGTMLSLCRGAVLTAVSQLYPIMQMLIGMAAVGIIKTIPGSFSSGRGLTGIIPVTLATLITGVGLIIPSLIAGIIITAILGRISPQARRRRRVKEQETDGRSDLF